MGKKVDKVKLLQEGKYPFNADELNKGLEDNYPLVKYYIKNVLDKQLDKSIEVLRSQNNKKGYDKNGIMDCFNIAPRQRWFAREEIISVLNETYVDAYIVYYSTSEHKAKFSTYLYDSFYNEVLAYFKNRKEQFYKDRQIEKYLLATYKEERDTTMDHLELLELNWDMFDFRCLNNREHEILEYYYIGRKSTAQIAEIYGLSEEAVRQVKKRIIDKVKDVNNSLEYLLEKR